MNIPNAHIFTFTEEYGPFMCEHEDCHKLTHSVLIPDDEYASIPDGMGGSALAHYIIEHYIGKRICKTCIKRMQTS